MNCDWIELDVRPMLASGREPFALIMNHLNTLEEGQGLKLTAPFYPAPLVDMLSGQGWVIESSESADGSWNVAFQQAKLAVENPTELDLRQLAPPEPMQRILDALETLPEGGHLVALTPFYPENVFPLLEERGYAWDVRRESEQTCRITISRA